MIRTPLRPLARILSARDRGENPDAIERENLRRRHEEMQDKSRARAEGRLLVLGLVFFCAFSAIGARMGVVSVSEAEEPEANAIGTPIAAQRGDIAVSYTHLTLPYPRHQFRDPLALCPAAPDG